MVLSDTTKLGEFEDATEAKPDDDGPALFAARIVYLEPTAQPGKLIIGRPVYLVESITIGPSTERSAKNSCERIGRSGLWAGGSFHPSHLIEYCEVVAAR